MNTETAAATQDSYEDAVKDGDPALVKLWLDAIAVSTSDEENWRKQAQVVVDLYHQSTSKDDYTAKRKFNILHSNVETIVPALYNSSPIPDVRRRFNDPDPVGKNVANIIERCLDYSI